MNIFNARLQKWADAGVGEPGRTVNPLADAFGGSNPSPPTGDLNNKKIQIFLPLLKNYSDY
jgi:hypothetical protein